MSYRKKTFSKKAIILTVIAAVLLLAAVVGTVAYIVAGAPSIKNVFSPTNVDIEVVETFDKTEKKDVNIKNTGDIPAYVRAAIVITWKDEAGNVCGQAPTASDYVLDQSGNTDWSQGSDGYWYYTTPVPAGQSTSNLIESIKLADDVTPPAGYYLSVDILAQAIQSEPADAVKDAWGENTPIGN